MRRFLFSFVALTTFLVGSYAQDIPAKRTETKESTTTVVTSKAKQGAYPQVTYVVTPEKGVITKNWIFVVDNSDSTLDVFHKALEGYKHVTQFPTDEWSFKLIVFSDAGKERVFEVEQEDGTKKDWHYATPEDFKAARLWSNQRAQRGVNSYGLSAMVTALQEKKDDLTIVLISDGGFTTACRVADEEKRFSTVEATIAAGQAWRTKNGFAPAVITTIGIRNSHYSAYCKACRRNYPGSKHNYNLPDRWESNKGHKPSDQECQAFLERLGRNYFGGYLVVENAVGTR